MKKWFIIPILALTLTSCSTLQSARDHLEKMSEQEYVDLVAKVRNTAYKGGEAVTDVVDDLVGLNNRFDVARFIGSLGGAIEEDNTAAVIKAVRELMEDKQLLIVNDAKLNEALNEAMSDGLKLLESTVGEIKLGIDGKLSERERMLLHALLDGFAHGLAGAN